MHLVEIFSSVQGEGPHVGRSTLFVRFAGCDLRCAWCDSPNTWIPGRECRIETAPGSSRFRSVANPLGIEAIEEALETLEIKRHRFMSLTGGEPLLQPAAVAALADRARHHGVRVYLETHGLAVEALEDVVHLVDVVSMDWKLASDVRRDSDPRGTRSADFHPIHERFLRVAAGASECTVKVVLTPSTEEAEIDEMCRCIAACETDTTLILQPVTPFAQVTEAPDAARLLFWLERCEARLPDVRLIPQTHRIYGAH